jgi:hypothetical protein
VSKKGKTTMHVVYYITGHGYGHGVRSAAICNAFNPGVRITFKTSLPRTFFQEELQRPFDFLPGAFDCGCVQNDSLSIDKAKTLAAYRAIALKNASRLKTEVRWCKVNRADVIVSDITPFAFEVAAHAGIPSVGVSNFTWYDIYEKYLCQYPEYGADVSLICKQYAAATLMCALAPALPMPFFPHRKAISAMVGRKGANRRKDIVGHYGLNPGKHLGLIYFGHYGLHSPDFCKLEQFADWEFIGVCELNCSARNYRCIAKNNFPYQDLVASVDAMICKLGYGAASECMLHGTPFVYPPRNDFAEFPALDAGVRAWGGGHLLSTDAFLSLDWQPLLEAVIAKGPPRAVPTGGAAECAGAIERVARGG